MRVNGFVAQTLRGLRMTAASLAVLQMSVGPVLAQVPVPAFGGFGNPVPGPGKANSGQTATPIKHVIVIIGENRSFDHVFATYVPRRGQTVHNLLSEGIIQLDANKNAIPGPNFSKAQQLAASDLGGQDTFLLNPPKQEFPNNQLPLPEVGGPSGADGHFTPSSSTATTVKCGTTTVNGVTTTNFLTPAACAAITENGLPDATDANGLTYIQSLAAGGTLQESDTPDLRIANFANLPAGRSVPADQWHQFGHAGLQHDVHGLRRQSRASFLPDVAAVELQRRAGFLRESFRLQRQPVLLG
jgi:phospholipase C